MSGGAGPVGRRHQRMPSGITVRRLRTLEWRAFRDLRLAALRSDPMAFGSSFARESAYTRQKWQDWCRDGAIGNRNATFVAVSPSGKPVGMVGAFLVSGTARVWGMWTRPGWRNRGAARSLMARLLAWLAAYSPDCPVVLDVNPSQAAATRIYAALGFRFSGNEEPLGHDPPAIVRPMVRLPVTHRKAGLRGVRRSP